MAPSKHFVTLIAIRPKIHGCFTFELSNKKRSTRTSASGGVVVSERLKHRWFDTATNRYVYSNLRNADPTRINVLASVWRASIGLMYDF